MPGAACARPTLGACLLVSYRPLATALLAACKTLAKCNTVEQTRRWRGTWHRDHKKPKLRNSEQPRAPSLIFGRQRRAWQDVLLDEPSKGVALAQFGVQRHGDLAQGLAEGSIS